MMGYRNTAFQLLQPPPAVGCRYYPVFFGTLIILLFSAHLEGRIFTLSKGEKIDADFVRIEKDAVVLKLSNNNTRVIKMDRFSEADKIYIRDQIDSEGAGTALKNQPVSQKSQASPEEDSTRAHKEAPVGSGGDLHSSVRAGQMVPPLSLQAGEDILALEDLTGKVVLIYFWTGWSDSNRQTIPMLHRLNRAHRESGLEIIGINMDSNVHLMNRLAKAESIEWHLIWDKDRRISQDWGIEEIPTFFLIDRNGKIVLRDTALQPFSKYIEKHLHSE